MPLTPRTGFYMGGISQKLEHDATDYYLLLTMLRGMSAAEMNILFFAFRDIILPRLLTRRKYNYKAL